MVLLFSKLISFKIFYQHVTFFFDFIYLMTCISNLDQAKTILLLQNNKSAVEDFYRNLFNETKNKLERQLLSLTNSDKIKMKTFENEIKALTTDIQGKLAFIKIRS